MSKKIQGALAAFGVLSGAVAFGIDLWTAPSHVRAASVFVLAAAASVLLAVAGVPEIRRIIRANRALPSDVELDTLSSGYTIASATAEDIGWIAQHEAALYTSEDAIPETLLREWFAANPTGFSVVKTITGNRIGHIDILPLKPRTCQSFIAGDIVEREIRGDSLYSIDERNEITCLYVESVALCVPKPLSNMYAIAVMMASLPDLIERIANPAKIETIYAIAASEAGDRFMRRLGFEIIRPADRRKDAHNFFAAPWAIVGERAKAYSRLRPA